MRGIYKRCSPEALRERLKVFGKLQNSNLEIKLKFTEEIIDRSLAYGKSAVLFSGGKDSTVLLDILLRRNPKILIIHNNTTLGTKELLRFVRRQTRGYDYVETTAQGPIEMWQRTGHWPILGKRSHTSYKKVIPGLKVSPVQCCYQLKEKHSHRILKDRNIDVVFWGNRAGESERRKLTFLDNGYLFKPIRRKWMHSYPLQHWKETDILAYLEDHKIRRPEEISHESGCLPCATNITFYPNNISRLYITNRSLWEKYMRAGFAEQILRIKRIPEGPEYVINHSPEILNWINTKEMILNG